MHINYKAAQLITSILGTFMIALFIVLNVIYFYPYTVIRLNCPAIVTTKEVVPGGVLNFTLLYNKSFNVPEILSQQLMVADHIVNLGSNSGQLDVDANTIDLKLVIPKDIHSGTGKVKILVRYKLFYGMRVVNVERETETFTIKKME